jgi:anti-sigma regulatory factor (Ser/Thr protein kinase)
VQSVTGKWTEDEARRLTMYYLRYYRAEQAQLLRAALVAVGFTQVEAAELAIALEELRKGKDRRSGTI